MSLIEFVGYTIGVVGAAVIIVVVVHSAIILISMLGDS